MSDPSKIETNQNLDPVAHDRQTGSKKPAAGGGPDLGRATPSLSQPTPGAFSS